MHRHIIALLCLWAACGIQEHNAPHKAVVKADAGRIRDAAAPSSSKADAPPADEEPPPDQPDARRSSDQAVVTPPPPDDTPGVDLGGVRVPREKAIVILHFGHSNMLGEAYEPVELLPHFFTSAPRLWIFRDGAFVPAMEPTATTRRRDTAGPGMALLRAALAKAPPDYHFISVGLGVGSATTQDYTKGGLYYSEVIDRALQLKDRATFGAAVVMLGITDRHMPMALQPGFADRVVKIIADVRADLGMPQLPVLHTDYEMEATGTLAPTTDVGLLFRPLILSLPKRISRCAIIPTNGLGMEDDHHFNLAGQKLWSERAIQILIDKQWAPWPAP